MFIFECSTKEPLFHPNLKSTQMPFTLDHLQQATTRKELIAFAHENNINIDKALDQIKYEIELQKLQSELVNLQQWIHKKQLRVAVIFEGRDASGKGGSIKRFIEHLNPRSTRVVASNKPTNEESRQWYFRRYIKVLPNAGELVFFDRSWYNRAVVEPVNGFCTKKQYNLFMGQVNEFEKMLIDSETHLIKIYFSISKEEQAKRFEEIKDNPLKQWKITPVDLKAQELWNQYTQYKETMFQKTNTDIAPWHIIKADTKTKARLEALSLILETIPFIRNKL